MTYLVPGVVDQQKFGLSDFLVVTKNGTLENYHFRKIKNIRRYNRPTYSIFGFFN